MVEELEVHHNKGIFGEAPFTPEEEARIERKITNASAFNLNLRNFTRATSHITINSEGSEELLPQNSGPNSFELKTNRRISNVFANFSKRKKLDSQKSVEEDESSLKQNMVNLNEILTNWNTIQNEKRFDEYFQKEHKVYKFD